MLKLRESLTELKARERVKALLDEGTFRELIPPHEQLESPHLAPQGVVPQSDDGVIVGRGLLGGENAVVVAIEGDFQGGGIGEVAGSKIAGAFERALKDHENGIPTRPVLIFDTGGVRLQEANYGLLTIAEIQASIVALREKTPVIGIIPGKIGSFGGMSIAAGLFSKLLITKEGRLGLNGPEVIEQEAGIEEFDAGDRQLVWRTVGGEQRQKTDHADTLIEDDIQSIRSQVMKHFEEPGNEEPRCEQISSFLHLLHSFDPSESLTPEKYLALWKESKGAITIEDETAGMSISADSNGSKWFTELMAIDGAVESSQVKTVRCGDTIINGKDARVLAVVPDKENKFPRVRGGEVGLEEGWTIAYHIHQAIEEDKNKEQKRAIVAVVDVPSQAYGYNEELIGIHLACAAAANAYAKARLAGHPVVSLVVGKAISGAFLAHGLQANRILAVDDPSVQVQVMSKESNARITRRSLEQLEQSAKTVPSTAYDIRSFQTLGALHKLITDVNASSPLKGDTEKIMKEIDQAIDDSRLGKDHNLQNRLTSKEAVGGGRKASLEVRKRLNEQWN
ncbi:biotin-independent malonate decarboxylase subunit beta [Bacillus sp. FJAT-44742]|uniref:biotin-independent malonate decarboxylase subunit beta n=1 Tax=Bacillus sp. FJAT-44742 TaxID=2014005 RepID=UPI000C2431D7|nr:biotin-independent malonate decarboxylase subunit beta [Bacillus sp. FJAT-44742]